MTRLSVVYDMIQRGQNLGFQNPTVFFFNDAKKEPISKRQNGIGKLGLSIFFQEDTDIILKIPWKYGR